MHLNYCTKHPDKETYICQVCGRILCDACHPLESRHDITKNEHAGNVCPDCVKAHDVFKRMEHLYAINQRESR